MSDYGADSDTDLLAAQHLAYILGFLPLDKTNVMQWTYPDDVTVRKLANKTGKSNCLFKFAPPPADPVIPPDLPPVPAGDACTVCWGNGLPFGVGETPESITVVVQNVEKGPSWIPAFGEPPNGTFELPQNPGLACGYFLVGDDFSIFFQFAPVVTALVILQNPSSAFSFEAFVDICQTSIDNQVGIFFTGGTATIFIPPIS